MYNHEKLNIFPIRYETKQGYLLSPLLLNIVLVYLDSAIRQQKYSIQIGNKEK